MMRSVCGTVVVFVAIVSVRSDRVAVQAAEGEAGDAVVFDVYSGYFVSNQFEPDAAASFVMLADQASFDEVFGVAFVMRDKSHRLPKDVFDAQIVLAAIKRGAAFHQYQVEGVAVKQGAVHLRYSVKSRATPETTFACPLIISIPKGAYRSVVFIENGKLVKTLPIGAARKD